jgi:hypothetical protein
VTGSGGSWPTAASRCATRGFWSPSRQATATRVRGHEGFAEYRLEAEFRLVGRGFAQQPDVDGLVVQGGDLRRGGHLVDVQVHLGKPLPEGAQQAGQDRQGEGGGEADPQAARLPDEDVQLCQR